MFSLKVETLRYLHSSWSSAMVMCGVVEIGIEGLWGGAPGPGG